MTLAPLPVLLIENEPAWEERLTGVLRGAGAGPVTVFRTFAEAEREIARVDLLPFQFAVVDVRMRKQLFDQGGLALLHQLKSRRPLLPVLILSAYYDDYPGIRAVVGRYQRVATGEKEAFAADPGPVLEGLLQHGPGYDVFISYRRDGGAELAHLLRIALERRGCRVFLDVRSLRAGPFDEALVRAIEATRNFVVLLTPGALDRCAQPDDWFRREIACALRAARRVIPFRKDGVDIPPADALPPEIAVLSRLECVSYSTEFPDAAVSRLCELLEV